MVASLSYNKSDTISNYNTYALCLSSLLLVKLIAKDGAIMRAKKEINIQVGEQIKEAREKTGLTQEQFAERIEVSPQFVSDMERGVVGVSLTTLKRVCIVLGVSSDQILFGKTTESVSAVMAEKCKSLSPEQYIILGEIIEKYIQAISLNQIPKIDAE